MVVGECSSKYSGLDTGRLKCLGLNGALLFTVPSARDVVTDFVWKQRRESSVFRYFLWVFWNFLMNLANY